MLYSIVSASYMWLFALKLKTAKYSFLQLVMYWVLNGHMWLVVTILDSTDRKFFRTAVVDFSPIRKNLLFKKSFGQSF